MDWILCTRMSGWMNGCVYFVEYLLISIHVCGCGNIFPFFLSFVSSFVICSFIRTCSCIHTLLTHTVSHHPVHIHPHCSILCPSCIYHLFILFLSIMCPHVSLCLHPHLSSSVPSPTPRWTRLSCPPTRCPPSPGPSPRVGTSPSSAGGGRGHSWTPPSRVWTGRG